MLPWFNNLKTFRAIKGRLHHFDHNEKEVLGFLCVMMHIVHLTLQPSIIICSFMAPKIQNGNGHNDRRQEPAGSIKVYIVYSLWHRPTQKCPSEHYHFLPFFMGVFEKNSAVMLKTETCNYNLVIFWEKVDTNSRLTQHLACLKWRSDLFMVWRQVGEVSGTMDWYPVREETRN